MEAAGDRSPAVLTDVEPFEVGSVYPVVPGRLGILVKSEDVRSLAELRDHPQIAKMHFFTSDFHTHFPLLKGEGFGCVARTPNPKPVVGYNG